MRILNATKVLACILALLLVCMPFSVSALCGDVDNSGDRTVQDYLQIKRFVLGSFDLQNDGLTNADVDFDGVVSAKDYMMLKRHVLGTFEIPSPEMKKDPEWDVLTQMLTSVNAERAKYGLQPLVLSAELCVVAYDKSSDMAQNHYFDHTSPIYGDPADMLDSYGVQFLASGENIAAGQQTVADVMNAWMNSYGHRANILNPTYTEMGLGVAYGGEYGIYWTLVLCQSR